MDQRVQTAICEHLLCAMFTFRSAGGDEIGAHRGWPPNQQQPGRKPGASPAFLQGCAGLGPSLPTRGPRFGAPHRSRGDAPRRPHPEPDLASVPCGLAGPPMPRGARGSQKHRSWVEAEPHSGEHFITCPDLGSTLPGLSLDLLPSLSSRSLSHSPPLSRVSLRRMGSEGMAVLGLTFGLWEPQVLGDGLGSWWLRPAAALLPRPQEGKGWSGGLRRLHGSSGMRVKGHQLWVPGIQLASRQLSLRPSMPSLLGFPEAPF